MAACDPYLDERKGQHMSGSGDHSPPKGKGLSLPGQPTEEAIAEVGSEAGKSIVRGFGRLGNALTSEWVAKREAKAEAARVAIETDAEIKKDAALEAARREYEIAELNHRAALERRAARLRIELAREQINLEAIERRALEFTERDPNNGEPREIDEDWLFRFADIAQKVSDADVQNLWARALSSASMQNSVKLSAAALQTLGLFDKDIAEDFKKFVTVIVRIGFMTHPGSGLPQPEPIGLAALMDMGLVREIVSSAPLNLSDFSFETRRTANLKLPQTRAHLGLTKRGSDIANAVFKSIEELPLGEDLEQAYLQNALEQELKHPGTAIVPTLADGSRREIRLTARNSITETIAKGAWKTSDVAPQLSRRLIALLEWVEPRYEMTISDHNDDRA